MAKKTQTQSSSVSKFKLDEEKVKNETIPNPVVVSGWEEIGLKRIAPTEIEKYLLMHPAIPRGTEIKVNRMIKLIDEDLEENVIPNKTKTPLSKQARDYCRKILEDSEGPLFIKDMGLGAFRFGTSFAVIQTDKDEKEVLRFEHQHEVFFGPARYPKDVKDPKWGNIPIGERSNLAGKMKIDPITKKIDKFTQYMKRYQSKESNYDGTSFIDTRKPEIQMQGQPQLEPYGEEFDKSKVSTLLFDKFGDEPLGIPLIQFLHLTVTYLLNMEKGAAQTQVNFGFNKWKAMTPFRDQVKLQQFASSLSRINTDAVVCLPEGITLENIQPGRTDFDKVHPIFMKLIGIRLGIPYAILTMDGGSTNKASIAEQRKDMYEDFIADELTIESTINDLFWKACRIKYNTLSHEQLEAIVPKFKFKQPEEDKDIQMDRNLKFSLMIRNFATAAVDMGDLGQVETVEDIAIKIRELLNSSYDPQKIQEIRDQFTPKKLEKPKTEDKPQN